MQLEKARIRWALSAETVGEGGERLIGQRHLSIDGATCDLSQGNEASFVDLYRRVLSGSGWGIEDARPAIDLVHGLTS
jgi:UDP-N-acetyl-2-amino-2-deoxyglucuronate dehydrogenase